MYFLLENNILKGQHAAIIFSGVAGFLRSRTKTSAFVKDSRDNSLCIRQILGCGSGSPNLGVEVPISQRALHADRVREVRGLHLFRCDSDCIFLLQTLEYLDRNTLTGSIGWLVLGKLIQPDFAMTPYYDGKIN